MSEHAGVELVPLTITSSSQPGADRQLFVRPNEPLLAQLLAQGVAIRSSCGGHGVCTDCVVKVVRGADNCSFLNELEQKKLGNVTHLTGERLSCQLSVVGPVRLDLTVQDQLKRGKKKTPGQQRSVATPPQGDVRLHKAKPAKPPRPQAESSRPSSAPLDDFQWKKGGLKRPKRAP
jgi:ferredoxin, 2Fe-2S